MRLCKWGNSLALGLPRMLADKLALKASDDVEVVDATGNPLAIEKSERRARALERMRTRSWTLPADYRFDREGANER